MFHYDVEQASRNRVNRGVTLLDDHQPDWWTKINLSTLDLDYQDMCILGQLYGDYEIGLDALGVVGSGMPYGFSSAYAEKDERVWREIIIARQTMADATE